jgi:hypothetical protein
MLWKEEEVKVTFIDKKPGCLQTGRPFYPGSGLIDQSTFLPEPIDSREVQ